MSKINNMDDRIYPVGLNIVGPQHEIGYADNDITLISDVREFEQKLTVELQMNVMVYCQEGRMQLDVDNEPHQLTPHTLLLCHNKAILSHITNSSDYKGKALLITDKALQSLLQSEFVSWSQALYVWRIKMIDMNPMRVQRAQQYCSLLQERLQIPSSLNKSVVYSLLRAAMLELCEMMELQGYEQQKDDNMLRSEEIFYKFIDLLAVAKQKRQTVAYYANQLCISAKYLSTICKLVSGKSPILWISEYIMEDIRSLLKNTNLSCKEISDQLGFPNGSYFGRYVKERIGMSPAAYRLSMREPSA